MDMLETWIYHGNLNDQYGEIGVFNVFVDGIARWWCCCCCSVFRSFFFFYSTKRCRSLLKILNNVIVFVAVVGDSDGLWL